MSDTLSEKILGVLTPLLGAGMAKIALDLQCKKLNVTHETLTTQNLIPLANHLQKALVGFVGIEKANEVASQIRQLTI